MSDADDKARLVIALRSWIGYRPRLPRQVRPAQRKRVLAQVRDAHLMLSAVVEHNDISASDIMQSAALCKLSACFEGSEVLPVVCRRGASVLQRAQCADHVEYRAELCQILADTLWVHIRNCHMVVPVDSSAGMSADDWLRWYFTRWFGYNTARAWFGVPSPRALPRS